jgi:cytochrome c oxidase cbb3-type subunit 3
MSDSTREPIIHVYDDIEEADNRLPRWWLYTLYGAIVFAAGYWLYFEAYGTGKSPVAAYRAEKLAAAREEAKRLQAEGPMTEERLIAMSKNPTIVSAGRTVFAQTCASCHKADGGGQVGPNLTDEYWVHGGAPEKILVSVRNGWVDKGMPAWGPQLGEGKVREVAAYVLSLKGTKVAGGKEPQGDRELQ